MSNGLIVVADDDLGVAQLVEAALVAEGFSVATVHDGEAALSEIRSLKPDAAVLDVMMPHIDGVSLCRRLREDPTTRRTSVILLTAMAASSDRLAGLRAGADDYVTKPFDPVELAERVKLAVHRTRAMAALNPLTGLPGNEEVRTLLERLTQETAPFAVLHIDLNDFKAYNDHYGVMRGDEAIKKLAAAIGEGAREVAGGDAFLGHVGGDDFLVVIEPDKAEALASEVIRRWDEGVFDLYDARDALRGSISVYDRRREKRSYPLMGVSIGIATTTVRRFDTHLEAADVAAEMKGVAKRTPGSSFAIDRRKEGAEVPPEPKREEGGHLLRPLRRARPPARLREELQYLAAATKAADADETQPDLTVVIVDDEEDVRDVLRLHCELHGYPVVGEAADGTEAVRQVIKHEPAIVILDYRMPEMDGDEAAKLIREAVPQTKIIAFSGVLVSRPEWADDFLNKYQIAEISPLLGRLLETKPTP